MGKKNLIILSIASAICLNHPRNINALCEKQDSKFLTDYDTNQEELCNEATALLYLSHAFLNLESKEHQKSFHKYQKAAHVLLEHKNPAIDFFVLFGMVVAADNLHLEYDRQHYFSCLENLIKNELTKQEETPSPTSKDFSQIKNHLIALAHMSDSIKTEESLLSLISDFFSAPSSNRQKSPLQPVNLLTLSCHPEFLERNKASIGKEIEKTFNKFLDIWNKFYKFYKEFREVEEDIKNRIK